MNPVPPIVAILTTIAWGAPRYEVVNHGESVEINAVQGVPEPTPEERASESFFTGSEPAVIPDSATVTFLAQQFTNAVRDKDRAALLGRLSRTKPVKDSDFRWLLNLYSRSQPEVREHCEASLSLLGPEDTHVAVFLESLLQDEDPQLQRFGLVAAARVRPAEALPLVKALAEPAFKDPAPSINMSPADSARWGVHFAALAVLADWQGAATLPLLLKRAKEAPAVAELAVTRFWAPALEALVSWSESDRAADAACAAIGWTADVPRAQLAQTRDRLWALLLDKRRRAETRHRAGVKLGLAAEAADVDRLLAERAKADGGDRLLLDTALFATRSPKAVPVLVDYAKNAKDPATRAGTLSQLREMLPAAEYKGLLGWAAKDDPDPENRASAAAELKGFFIDSPR